MMNGRIEVIQGDITEQHVDAIVNAANRDLQGGGGVDGAIHAAAGPQLLRECRTVSPCPTGEARITRGYNLPAKWVIHTVGPVWNDGRHDEPELLANCYRNSLAVTEQYPIRTIAFPSISTGIYGYPVELAAPVAVREVTRYLEEHDHLDTVVFVCFGNETYAAYLHLLAAARSEEEK